MGHEHEDDDTILDMKRGAPRAPNGRWIKWALAAAIAMLCVALVIAIVRNAALNERAMQAETVAAARVAEIKRLSEQPAPVAKVPSTEPSASEAANEQYEVDESASDPNGLDGGAAPPPAEKW